MKGDSGSRLPTLSVTSPSSSAVAGGGVASFAGSGSGFVSSFYSKISTIAGLIDVYVA